MSSSRSNPLSVYVSARLHVLTSGVWRGVAGRFGLAYILGNHAKRNKGGDGENEDEDTEGAEAT